MQRKRKKFKVKTKVNKYAQIIEDELDLHGYTQQETKDLVVEFLDNARHNEFEQVRIITGKGLHSSDGQGVLKELVESILRKKNVNFQEAKINEGGSGAININLKS